MSCTSIPNAHFIFYCTKQSRSVPMCWFLLRVRLCGRMHRTNKTTACPLTPFIFIDRMNFTTKVFPSAPMTLIKLWFMHFTVPSSVAVS